MLWRETERGWGRFTAWSCWVTLEQPVKTDAYFWLKREFHNVKMQIQTTRQWLRIGVIVRHKQSRIISSWKKKSLMHVSGLRQGHLPIPHARPNLISSLMMVNTERWQRVCIAKHVADIQPNTHKQPLRLLTGPTVTALCCSIWPCQCDSYIFNGNVRKAAVSVQRKVIAPVSQWEFFKLPSPLNSAHSSREKGGFYNREKNSFKKN